jgi:hypothetical protein
MTGMRQAAYSGAGMQNPGSRSGCKKNSKIFRKALKFPKPEPITA